MFHNRSFLVVYTTTPLCRICCLVFFAQSFLSVQVKKVADTLDCGESSPAFSEQWIPYLCEVSLPNSLPTLPLPISFKPHTFLENGRKRFFSLSSYAQFSLRNHSYVLDNAHRPIATPTLTHKLSPPPLPPLLGTRPQPPPPPPPSIPLPSQSLDPPVLTSTPTPQPKYFLVRLSQYMMVQQTPFVRRQVRKVTQFILVTPLLRSCSVAFNSKTTRPPEPCVSGLREMFRISTRHHSPLSSFFFAYCSSVSFDCFELKRN